MRWSWDLLCQLDNLLQSMEQHQVAYCGKEHSEPSPARPKGGCKIHRVLTRQMRGWRGDEGLSCRNAEHSSSSKHQERYRCARAGPLSAFEPVTRQGRIEHPGTQTRAPRRKSQRVAFTEAKWCAGQSGVGRLHGSAGRGLMVDGKVQRALSRSQDSNPHHKATLPRSE